MVDLVAALLIQMTDATSVVIGGTTPTIATVSAREEAVAAAGELTPGPLPLKNLYTACSVPLTCTSSLSILILSSHLCYHIWLWPT